MERGEGESARRADSGQGAHIDQVSATSNSTHPRTIPKLTGCLATKAQLFLEVLHYLSQLTGGPEESVHEPSHALAGTGDACGSRSLRQLWFLGIRQLLAVPFGSTMVLPYNGGIRIRR